MIVKKFNELFFPHDNKKEHFKALDGLRGIAVLFVLLSHSSNMNIFIHDYLNFQRIGKVGVYLFFVLSAYLLDRQIAQALIDEKSTKSYWSNYFLRRFLRIYPLFFLALILHGLLTFFGFPTVIDNIKDIPAHMILLRGESVFWSIPVEFKYYFISPLIMWFCHKYLHWDKFKILIMFLGIIILTILIEWHYKLPLISTIKYFPIFIVGTLISIYELLYQDNVFKNVKSWIFSSLGFFSLLIIVVTIPFYFKIIFGFSMDFHSSIFYFPYACVWGLLLLSTKYGAGLIRRIFEIKLLRFIGSISFSIYLFHMPFLTFVSKINIPSEFKIYVFFLMSIVFSSLSYLFIERPLSKIRIKPKNINKRITTANIIYRKRP